MTQTGLVKLAVANDPLLAQYSKRWTEKNKHGNPVITAVRVFNARLYGLAFIAFCGVLSMIGSILDMYWLAVLPITLIVGVLTFVVLNRSDYKDMMAFCEAISMLEREMGTFETPTESMTASDATVLFKWQQEEWVAREGEKILRAQAKEVKALQSFPWRVSEAARLRSALENKLALIKGLAPVEENIGMYFN